MKKITSVLSLFLVVVLLFSCMPIAIAEETPTEPSYGESFLLWVESETRREYSAEDFPLVENLSYVNIVKMTPVETGYRYLLLMVLLGAERKTFQAIRRFVLPTFALL